jgi:hypothetical protein
MTSINNLRWMAGAMDSEADRPPQWQPAELATMLRHQLAASVAGDLQQLSPDLAKRFDGVKEPSADPASKLIYAALFTNPTPSLEALQVVKDFSKRAIAEKDGPLPEEIGAALYYASIAAALLRLDKRISGLDDATLKIGLNWALAQPWMDVSLAVLFRELLPRLK